MSEADTFDKDLSRYLSSLQTTSNERERAQLFIEFLRRDLNVSKEFVGHPTKLRPNLEEYLSGSEETKNRSLSEFTGGSNDGPAQEAKTREEQTTAFLSGYLDARVGNLIIEFKDNLSSDLDDAKDQLRKYVYLLREQEGIKEDFVCFATDGEVFQSFEARTPGTVSNRDDVVLDQLSEIDLSKVEANDAQRWFRAFISERVHPTVDKIHSHFGVGSDLFNACIPLLKESYEESDVASVCYSEWSKYLEYAQGQTVEQSDVNPEELFLRHTYLASFARLLNYLVFTRGSIPSPEEASEVISGDIGGSFPENLFEEDLFSWIGETEQGVDLSRRFLDVFLNFNLGQINRDIFKQLYQEMVSPGVRHDLGEYYTPDWLATYLINELKLDPEASVLDPGCGSGTFLVEAIHDKKERNSRSIPDFLDDLQREVVGIDVHPLAVAIARANYVVAVEDLLSERRSTFRIPVHLADSLSLKLRFSDELSTIDLGGAEVLDEPITIWDGEYSYSIPIKGIQSPSKFDTALDIVSDYLDDKRGFEKRFCREIPDFENIVHVFENIREEMAQAEKDGRDSIHAFILRNFSRPLQLMEHRFDAVVGNPPFLTYNSMGSDQQKNVKELLSAYNLYPGGGNVVNMDISTLFVARTSDLYLKEQGRLAFVMTRGIFSARQHEPFRRGEMSIPLSFDLILDLDEVHPLFKPEDDAHVPTAAIMCTKGVDLSYPVPLRELRGELSDRNLSLSEAEQLLTAEEGEIELGDGEITSWESVFETKQSDYHSDVHQAADLTPRVFTSVELDESATSLGFDSDQPPVRTPDTVMSKAKEPYDEVGPLHGKVEKEFLYGTLLASDLVPFAHRDFRPVVVPATPNRTNYEVLELEQAREGGYPGLANWLEEANQHWSSDKEGVQTVSQRLNHWGRITSQNPGATYKVGYTGRGKNLAGCVVKSDSVSDRSNDPRLELQGVILDHSVFYYETDDEEEAYYLAAVLNSDVLTERVNSMQTKGDFGARNIQKIPFEFPLPVYDPNDPNHQRLIELAKQGEKKALAALPDLEKEYEPDKKPMNIRWVREKISNKVEPELNEVDEIVEGYLDF